MKVTNLEVWAGKAAIGSLLEEPWPVKTAYWLAKLSRKLTEQHAVIEEVRVKLIKQYGQEGEQGQITIARDSPDWPEFAAAFNELMDVEVDVPIDPITLPSDNGAKVTPAVLLALESFVVVAE